MRSSAIRHLAITDESSIVAAALFEKTVQIWSWNTGQQLGEFETMLDSGGRRLALTPDGSACIVGAWGQRGRGARGLAAYSIPDGKLLWNRKDIRHIQFVNLSGSGKEIYCGVEGASAHVIETATGELIGRVRGAEEVFGSRYTSHQLLVQTKEGRDQLRHLDRYLVRGENEFEISPNSFALLDAAFSPEAVCLSEATGGIRLIDLATGEPQWCLDLSSKTVTFNSADHRFYCVTPAGGPYDRTLRRLASSVLECDRVLALGKCWEEAFTPSGRVLVTVQGDVYETSTGTLLSHLDFPQHDYPDA